MRSSRLASLLIGATLIAGLFGTSATAVFAVANDPVTYAILREVSPHNGIDTIDQVYLSTDTITGTGDTDSVTFSLSATSPAQTASVVLTAPTGGALATGNFTGVSATPDATHPGLEVTVDGTVCVSNSSTLKINELAFTSTDVTEGNIYFEIACSAAGFSEIAGQIALAATDSLKAVVATPLNTLPFGNLDIGDTSAPQSITFRNIGNAEFDASDIALAGRYPEEYDFAETCGVLAPDATCTATVTYKPTKFDLREAAVIIQDFTLDGLDREVLVTGTGLLHDAVNTTPGTAIDIDPLPFYSGVQVQTVADTASSCGPDNKAAWYHFKSTTTKTIALTTKESDTATDLELFTGTAGSPTFIKCGVADINSRDALTWTATANTDYYIRLARDGVDYALVLKAVLGSADTMVDASGFALSTTSFFPVVDGYRDTINISGTRGETASVSIGIYNPAGSKIRTLTVPSGIGAYSVVWNGKNTAGALQAAGKYKIVTTVTDNSGNKLTDTRYEQLSHRKLTTKTYTQTLDAAKYTQLLKTGTGTASKTSTAYTGGLKMTSGSNGTVAAVYSFSAPSASTYTKVTFTVIGKGATNTMNVGLQDWKVCTAYSTTCITNVHSGPHSSGIASAAVSAPGSTSVYSTVHRIRAYVFAPALPGTTRVLDARDVKITVTYTVLA